MTAWMQAHPLWVIAIVWGFVGLAGLCALVALIWANPDDNRDNED